MVSLSLGGETKSSSLEDDVSSPPVNRNGLDVYFFYGQDCPHCVKVEPFLGEMKQKFPLNLHTFDIYNDRSSLSLFGDYCDLYGLPLEGRGVPAVFVSDTYFVGDSPILNGFEEAVKKALMENSSTDKAVGADAPKNPDQKAASVANSFSMIAVTVAALIDSVSPCSITILVFLIGARVLVADRRKRALRVGLAFCLSVFIAYFLFGLGLFTVVQVSGFSSIFSLLVGLAAVLAGIFYLKDVFWYGGGRFVMEVPRSLKPLLMKMLKGVTSPLGAFVIGFVVACFELPCTGGPYLFILGQLADNSTRLQAIPLLLYYNFVFVLPLIMTSLLLYSNILSLSRAREWNAKNRRLLRFISGSTLMALGFLVMPLSQVVQFVQLFLCCFKAVGPFVLITISIYFVVTFAPLVKPRLCSGTFLILLLCATSFLIPSLSVAIADSGNVPQSEISGVWKESTELDKVTLVENDLGVRIDPMLLEKARLNPDEVLRVFIVFGEKPVDYDRFIRSLNGKILHDYEIIEGVAISIPGRSLETLKELENVLGIHEDREVHAFLDESAPLISADDVWAGGINGSGIDVCIVDTGVNYDHPALAGKVVAQKCYCQGNPGPSGCCPSGGETEDDAMDDNGHGTHCAGIVASTNDTYKGVAPGSSIKAVKVLDSEGSGWESDIVAGIDWCSDQNADIISISLGGGLFTSYCDGEPDAQAVNNAVDAGAFVAISSGNDASTTHLSAPACASKGTSVGATYDADVGGISWGAPVVCSDTTTYADKIACVTNRDDILDLLAPGALITSTVLDSGFDTYGGTSMAAPHVAGAAALLLEAKPALTPIEIEAILKQTGKSIYDSETGLTFPRINVSAAVTLPSMGHLEPYLIDPTSDKYVAQHEVFNFSSGVKCVGGKCGNVSATLGTKEISYDDGSAENAWAWNDEGNMWAVGFTPAEYPVRLENAGFYIYPGWPDPGNDNFNVSIFDDDGPDGAPGTRLAGPVNSGTIATGRVDVDTSSLNITITDGDFYIALVQVGDHPDSVGIGTDENEPWAQRSWQRNVVAGGDWVQLDSSYGNILVRARVSIVSTVSGDAPFYTASDNPQICLNLESGDGCNQTWQVNATGNPGPYEFSTVYNPKTYAWYVPSNTTQKINITIIGAVHNVNSGLDYVTIQEAIDAPETFNGHAIIVSPGTYNENIDVNKSLSIRSVSNDPADTVVNASDQGIPVFNVTTNNVSIGGFTITGAGEDAGIYISGFKNSSISDNIVVDNRVGIHLSQPYYAYHNISSNTVNQNDIGIWLENSSFNVVSDNVIISNGLASIELRNSSSNAITYNNISLSEKGVIVHENSFSSNISYNNIFDNAWNLYNNQTDLVTAERNWWGGICCYCIDNKIYDNEEGKGEVYFNPVLDASYSEGIATDCWKHDVAITHIQARPIAVPQGQPIYINVTVENLGNFSETFNVIVYAGGDVGELRFEIGNKTVSLGIQELRLLEFVWDTMEVPCGTYYITAEAILPEDADPSDNIASTRVGGIGVPYSPHSVDIVGLLIPIALAILVIVSLGAAALGFFKILMSPRLRWPWRAYIIKKEHGRAL